MPLIGINISIDVTKIDKERLYKGEKGTYLSLTAFIDTTEQDQYGNNGAISQSLSKEERDNGLKLPILGNSKVFFQKERTADAQAPQTQQEQTPPPFPNSEPMKEDDQLPF